MNKFVTVRLRGGMTLRWLGKGKAPRPTKPPPKPTDSSRSARPKI